MKTLAGFCLTMLCIWLAVLVLCEPARCTLIKSLC